MGLFNFLRTVVTGVDVDVEQASMNKSDAKLAALNEAALRDGRYDVATYDQAVANYNAGRITDASGDVGTAFGQGFEEGFNNVTGGISNAITAPAKWSLRFIWQSIPGWLWFALVVFLLWKFGVLERLLRKAQNA